jgi:hypothetical protein
MNEKKGTNNERGTQTKIITDAERQAIIRNYRLEYLELVEPSLNVLEKWSDSQPTSGRDGDQHRRQLAKTRIVWEEVRSVMEAYRGKVGKTISPEALEALIEEARRRGHRRARMATDERKAPQKRVNKNSGYGERKES